MAKRKMTSATEETFGERLARLRLAAGYSQRDLAAEVGISQRMVAYYEGETSYPPSHLLPVFAKALRVSADTLLGLVIHKEERGPKDSRLWRRFQKIERMGAREKRQIIQFLDTFIEREQLKQKTAA